VTPVKLHHQQLCFKWEHRLSHLKSSQDCRDIVFVRELKRTEVTGHLMMHVLISFYENVSAFSEVIRV
jgi:hypothetical protein